MRQTDVGPFKPGLLFRRFSKNLHGPPLALFQILWVLVDFAKIAITRLFGVFEAAFLLRNLLQCLHFKGMLSSKIMQFAAK